MTAGINAYNHSLLTSTAPWPKSGGYFFAQFCNLLTSTYCIIPGKNLVSFLLRNKYLIYSAFSA